MATTLCQAPSLSVSYTTAENYQAGAWVVESIAHLCSGPAKVDKGPNKQADMEEPAVLVEAVTPPLASQTMDTSSPSIIGSVKNALNAGWSHLWEGVPKEEIGALRTVCITCQHAPL